VKVKPQAKDIWSMDAETCRTDKLNTVKRVCLLLGHETPYLITAVVVSCLAFIDSNGPSNGKDGFETSCFVRHFDSSAPVPYHFEYMYHGETTSLIEGERNEISRCMPEHQRAR